MERVCKCCWYTIVAYPICQSARNVYCGNMADWIRMLRDGHIRWGPHAPSNIIIIINKECV